MKRKNEEKERDGERITTSHLTGNKKNKKRQQVDQVMNCDDSCHRNRNSEEKDSLSFFLDGNICEKRTILIVK